VQQVLQPERLLPAGSDVTDRAELAEGGAALGIDFIADSADDGKVGFVAVGCEG
jgi:hypothetical protein